MKFLDSLLPHPQKKKKKKKSRVEGGGVAGLKAGLFIIVFYPCGPSYWFEDWSVALPKPMKCIPNIW